MAPPYSILLLNKKMTFDLHYDLKTAVVGIILCKNLILLSNYISGCFERNLLVFHYEYIIFISLIFCLLINTIGKYLGPHFGNFIRHFYVSILPEMRHSSFFITDNNKPRIYFQFRFSCTKLHNVF